MNTLQHAPFRFVWLFCVVLLSQSACTNEIGADAANTEDDSAQNGLDIIQDRGKRRLIVFVHGFTGDAVTTWLHDRSNAYWPSLLADDETFNDSDIAVYSYPTSIFERNFSIDEIADNLRLRLDSVDVKRNYKEIVFLSHSMGGLVVRAFALKYRDYPKIPMSYFFATPSNGADLAKIAATVSGNRQVEGLQSSQTNLYLQSQSAQWMASPLKSSVRSYCAYETKTTHGIMVVPQDSATALCNERLDPIAENHVRIAKPANTQSDPYVAFKVAYQETFQSQKIVMNGAALTIDSEVERLPIENGVVVLDSLTVKGVSIRVPDETLLVLNDLNLDGGSLTGRRFSVVAATVRGGSVDVSGGAGENGGELLIAAGRVLGTKILADGGNGTNGSNGTDGKNGSPGDDGSKGDCRPFGKYKGARSGEDGSKGTDGVDGANGMDGGNGGRVYLVSLNRLGVEPVVSGGKGGDGGAGGRSGQGGQGGRGGKGCTGLGGTQMNAADGSNGLNGRDGLPGVRGRDGSDGEVWSRQIDTFEDIAEHIPTPSEVPDYANEIRESLKSLAKGS